MSLVRVQNKEIIEVDISENMSARKETRGNWGLQLNNKSPISNLKVNGNNFNVSVEKRSTIFKYFTFM